MYSLNINLKNHVQIAVNKLGGPTKASNILNVSNAAIHRWIGGQRIPDIDLARKAAELTGMKLEQLRPVE